MPKVSVIIPIYNVENYIERCVRSLFEQTLYDIEYIFVNDCTQDKSILILERIINEYPNRKKQVKIIHHSKNCGLSNARASGMRVATGEYLIHCDSDDWVDSQMYELMYNKAKTTHSDIVVCDFVHVFKDSNKLEHYNPIKDPHDCIILDNGTQWWSCCNRMVKSSLFVDFSIIPIANINMLEDFYLMMKVYYYANSVEYVPKCLYNYNRTNQSSIIATSHYSHVLNQKIIVLKSLELFFKMNNFKTPNAIIQHKISTRDQFLIIKPRKVSLWRETFPEVVSNIFSNKKLKLTYRFFYLLASKGIYYPLFFYLKLSKMRRF